MRYRKGLLVLAAATLPLASVALMGGTAFAKTATGTGKVTCSVGGTLTFTPPLSAKGTTAAKKEVTTVTASLSRCSGGTPPGSPVGTTIKAIKVKATTKGAAVGSCGTFISSAAKAVLKAKQTWSGAKPTKFTVNGLHSASKNGQVGFTGSTTATGSYAGPVSVAAYLTSASTGRLLACSGSISSLALDPSISTISQ